MKLIATAITCIPPFLSSLLLFGAIKKIRIKRFIPTSIPLSHRLCMAKCCERKWGCKCRGSFGFCKKTHDEGADRRRAKARQRDFQADRGEQAGYSSSASNSTVSSSSQSSIARTAATVNCSGNLGTDKEGYA